MRYSKDFIGLNSILKNILSKYDLDNLSVNELLFKNWRDIVGQELAEYFIPRYQRGEILFVQTVKTAGSRELKSQQKKLRQRINASQSDPPVRDVKFI